MSRQFQQALLTAEDLCPCPVQGSAELVHQRAIVHTDRQRAKPLGLLSQALPTRAGRQTHQPETLRQPADYVQGIAAY